MHKLLFLCTANYYRSRFAEIFFNALAAQRHLDWVADSRGIMMEVGAGNAGPISGHTIRALNDRGISVGENVRLPMKLKEQDLKQADLIIALDEEEHRPYMHQRFPDWADKIDYWHVHDLHESTAEDALPLAEREIRALVERLSTR
jgi:low molecular weight protein-tyrosine phosphatase